MAKATTIVEESTGRSAGPTVSLDEAAASPASKRVLVHELFTTIAPGYDRFNRLASLSLDQGWRRRAVALGGVTAGMRVLDVCTGTGDLALCCARQIGRDGLVVGLDFTEAMLYGARLKEQRLTTSKFLQAPASNFQLPASSFQPLAPSIFWLNGDAQALPFRDQSFDRVFIGFSTRNLSDLRQGIGEFVRVLKPGGRLVILETGRPANPLVRAGYLLFLGTVVRAIGWIVTGRVWPFTYLARSVKGFLAPAEFVALINGCGAPAQYIPLSGGLASLYIAQKPS